jgi:heme exporter protein C
MFTLLASPRRINDLLHSVHPWLVALSALLLGSGVYTALVTSPPDYQQGEMVRVMYLHVPAAWWSLGIYSGMAVSSFVFLVWRHSMADLIARESAPIALCMTLVTLATGSLWGRPTWGTYWVWDARLTSMLILFLILAGYTLLARQADHHEGRQKACALLCLFGAINLPIIKFSVEWWNTLHQPASLLRSGGSAIAPEMLLPLGLMGTGFFTLYLVILSLRIRSALLQAKIIRLRATLIRRQRSTAP